MYKVQFDANGKDTLSWLKLISRLRSDCTTIDEDVRIFGMGRALTAGQLTAGACLKEHFRRYGFNLIIDCEPMPTVEKVIGSEIELQGRRISDLLLREYGNKKIILPWLWD